MKKLNVFLKGLSVKSKGFTLIEILVVIGIIAVLAAIVIVAINPARQFAQARNTQRTSNVESILNAIGQNMADNKGIFTCEEDGSAGNDPLPASVTDLSKSAYDIRLCIVPTYITEVPVDPSTGTNTCNPGGTGDADCTDTGESYDTDYTVDTDTNGRVTICAPGGNEAALNSPGAICLTR